MDYENFNVVNAGEWTYERFAAKAIISSGIQDAPDPTGVVTVHAHDVVTNSDKDSHDTLLSRYWI